VPLRQFLNRCRTLFRKAAADRELNDEIRSHLDMAAEQNLRHGMNPEQARQAARRDFGGVEQIKETYREQGSFPTLDSLLQDVRFGLRSAARTPLFTVVAILTLALGIGATTAVFSVVDRILFRSLPYPEPERLVSVGMVAPIEPNEFMLGSDYLEWRRRQEPFTSITSWSGITDCDITDQSPVRLSCARVESTFLDTFGIKPWIGRNFTADEDRPNAPRVALISYGLWQSRFARDPAIAGKTLLLDGEPAVIVGVLPRDFELPTLAHADLVVPQKLDEARNQRPSTGGVLRAFARLKPGFTPERATAALGPLFTESLGFVPPQFRKEVHLQVRSLQERQVADARLASLVLLGAVLAVLLIACANVANLLLARAARRRRELAVRAALGAGRLRLIRQTLTESLLLGLMGGLAGCLLAFGLLRWFVAIAPQGIPRIEQAQLDPRVLLFTLAASILCGLLFGLAPALHRPRPADLAGGRTVGPSASLGRHLLVGAQVAVSVILLAGAGLLLRSLWNLQNEPLGITTRNVITTSIVLGQQSYPETAQRQSFFEELESRLRRAPGVTALAISDTLPPSGQTRAMIYSRIDIPGREPIEEGTGGMVVWRAVTPGYFDALGIHILAGRAFREQDRDPQQRAIILSETLARRLFPNEDPLGKQLRFGRDANDWYTVIGIAADVKNAGLTGPADPEYYLVRPHGSSPFADSLLSGDGGRRARVVMRAEANPTMAAEWMKAEIAAFDPTLPISIDTLSQQVSQLAQRPRFNAMLLGLFASTGLLLAAVGLYGVMAFLVTERTREIGVRMALGATPAAVSRLVLSHAARWTLGGAALGLAGAVAGTTLLKTMLFGIEERDPGTLLAAALILVAVALLAAWIPSRRAASVDPMAALRLD
jgi:putative ABC transport system permease protein